MLDRNAPLCSENSKGETPLKLLKSRRSNLLSHLSLKVLTVEALKRYDLESVVWKNLPIHCQQFYSEHS